MSLTDLMSGMSLSTYPTIALVLFLSAFFSITIQIMRRSCRQRYRVLAENAPHDGDQVQSHAPSINSDHKASQP